MSITAEQALANSLSSTYGTEEILKSVYRSIEVASKTGKKSVAKSFSKEAVSKEELETALQDIRSKGFTVDIISVTTAQHCLKICW